MNRRRLSRPSIKITCAVDQWQGSHFIVEVWNPFADAYQKVDSVEDGLRRVDGLADLIGQMWLQRHPKRDALVDVPGAFTIGGASWAELRINATTFRSYDTRSADRLVWARAVGISQATAMICTKVGYSRSLSTASA
jgi:hypothetical protein